MIKFMWAVIIVILIGWGMNIYKFANADFKEPYKEEALRGIGIVVVPMGGILGYMTLENEE
jgi:hypothetical protein